MVILFLGSNTVTRVIFNIYIYIYIYTYFASVLYNNKIRYFHAITSKTNFLVLLCNETA